MYNQDKYNYEEYLNNNDNIKINKNKKQSVNKKTFIILIIIVIIIVFLSLIFWSKTNHFFNQKGDNDITSNSNVSNKNLDNIKYNTITFDKLTINVPTPLKEKEKNSNYLIYSTDDYGCTVTIIKTEKNKFKDINSLIKTMLESETSNLNGNTPKYNIASKNINGEKWSYVLTSIKIKNYILDEYIYVIVKNDNYFVINFQLYHDDSKSKNYLEIIEKSLKFKKI